MSASPLYAGVELGGTKCVCILAHGPDAVVAQQRIDTGSAEATITALSSILANWGADHAIAGLGVASFGPVELDPEAADYGAITATPKPGWRDTQILASLAAALPDVPASFDTDVNGAALAELRWGSGRGLSDFAYVTVGTGVGVGLIVAGQPVRGFAHAEVGHMRVPPLCGDHVPGGCPFHTDCVEGFASGPGIQAAIGARAISDLSPDDPVWDRVIHALAVMVHALACTTAPRRIAIGGGVLGAQPHLFERVESRLRASLNGYLRLPDQPYLVTPELGQRAGPLGAIALAMDAAVTV